MKRTSFYFTLLNFLIKQGNKDGKAAALVVTVETVSSQPLQEHWRVSHETLVQAGP